MPDREKSLTIKRREFLAGMVSAGVAAAVGHSRGVDASLRRPNVVMFVVDDMGWMDSTVYGSRYYETPNLERLAKRAVRFTNAYSAAPLCSATRASIMTGKYPARLHITSAAGHLPSPKGPLMPETGPPHQEVLCPRCQGYLPLDEYTLAEALRDAGYRTGFVGKWHLGHDEKLWPEYQGFDLNVGGGRWPGPPSYFSPYRISKLPDGPEGEYIADRLTDEALKFVEDAKDGPFYLNFWQYAVHAPYQSKEDYRRYFEGKQDPRGAQDNAVMAAMIKSMDESLGRLLDKLEELGLMDHTIILFSSDNGGNMYDRTLRDGKQLGPWAPEGRTPTNNAPLRGGKGSVYEGGVRVPTLIYWPNVTRGDTTSDEIISTIDYYPTLLDMIGVAPRPGQAFDGISVVPALLGRRLRRDALYGHFPHVVPAVPCQPASWIRKGDWKLIRFYQLDESFPNRLELYDLRHDIGEVKNLVASHPRRARDLERLLDKHLEDTHALVPKPNPNYVPGAEREIEGWRPNGNCWITRQDGLLALTSIGDDPFIINRTVPEASGELTIRFRMRSKGPGPGQFFWTTRREPQFGPGRRLDFEYRQDGSWQEHALTFDAPDPLQAIRIDPIVGSGKVEFEWIRVESAEEGAKHLAEWRFSQQ